MRLPAPRRARAARLQLGAAAAALAAAAAGASAAPPGGPVDTPGSPPGTLQITTPSGPVDGRIGFCVDAIRVDTAAGPVAQRFMLKLDDHGSYGIGPYTPTASGSLCATVSTDPADHAAARGGAADKLPADLCDASKPHTLRLLSGAWGAPGTVPEASQRSIAAPISVAGATCGRSQPRPPSPGEPVPGTPPGARPPAGAPAAAVRVRSTTVVVRGRSAYLKLGGAGAFSSGTVVLRSRAAIRIGRSPRARRTLARGAYQVAAGDAVELRLALTAQARVLLRTRRSIGATLTIAPSAGAAIARTVTVRRTR